MATHKFVFQDELQIIRYYDEFHNLYIHRMDIFHSLNRDGDQLMQLL
jgi:hypothetical protein